MQKNWYAVYTRPHCEKKVSLLLTKKGIENFSPLNYKKSPSLLRMKLLYEPLFKSYIFLRATDYDIIALSKQVNGIIGLLYWMSKPAIISEDDINAIKEFTNHHQEIKLEKIHVNSKSDENIIDGISFTMDGKILMIKNRAIKVNLPSLGFTMAAKMEDESIMGREIYFGRKESPLVH
jgi:transcription antitermination factor NusG